MAKAAIYLGASLNVLPTHHRRLFPHKPASVFHQEEKLSSNCGDAIRFQVYLRAAHKFFILELGGHGSMFNDVDDWERRAACLKGKPEMYQLWLSKQSTNFCATGVNMGRWFGTVTSCPNCSSCPAVTVDHLFRCKDVGRTKHFEDVVIALEDWMEANYTDPRLARSVSLYLCRFATLPHLDRDLL